MERNYNESRQAALLNENFNCSKMRSLIVNGNSHLSFSERFRNWINQYTKEAKEKVWIDIESYRPK